MKSPRKYLLAVCVFAIGFAAPVLQAEPDSPPPAKGAKGDPGARMQKLLGLSDEQAEKIKAIHADERAQLDALKAKEGDPKSKREEMKAIREATQTKVDAILTAEQREKAAKMRQEMKERMEKRKADKEGKGSPDQSDAAE